MKIYKSWNKENLQYCNASVATKILHAYVGNFSFANTFVYKTFTSNFY